MNRFHNQIALVTGAAQGIGRRVAERLAEEGARVVLVDRSELVFELAAELSPRYPVLALTADLEQYAECSRIMAAAIAHFGRLDVLVNNVGGTIWAKPFEHYQPQEIEAEVRRSLFPTLWCCHAALPQMLEQGVAPSSTFRPSPPVASTACPTARPRAGSTHSPPAWPSKPPAVACGSTPPRRGHRGAATTYPAQQRRAEPRGAGLVPADRRADPRQQPDAPLRQRR